MDQVRRYIAFLQEYSIPLILGVIAGLVWANIDFSSYHLAVEFDFWNFGQGPFLDDSHLMTATATTRTTSTSLAGT